MDDAAGPQNSRGPAALGLHVTLGQIPDPRSLRPRKTNRLAAVILLAGLVTVILLIALLT